MRFRVRGGGGGRRPSPQPSLVGGLVGMGLVAAATAGLFVVAAVIALLVSLVF
ncbi:MAG: hypothetical protein KY434_04310 [Actinobacteria bacterium]|nr:hypothetical protein [Actinomycetota bacterium]